MREDNDIVIEKMIMLNTLVCLKCRSIPYNSNVNRH